MRAIGQLLAADLETRELSYRLLPFGEPGSTSLGRVTVAAGAVALPSDPSAILLNVEHDPTRPVGRASSIVETAAGLDATFRVARTSAGDELLLEAAEGLRTGVSVELDQPVIRGGQLLGGVLTGAGAVVRPAFPSAQLVAADTATPEPTDPEPEQQPEPTADPEPEQQPEPDTEGDPVETDTLTAAAPAALPAQTAPVHDRSLRGVTQLLASLGAGRRDPQLLAALADITQTAVGADVEAPQFIGEVWSGAPYQRQIVPLIGHGDLTSYKITGWRWTTPPVGADYTGDKNAVPSNAAATEPVDYDAARWAGAHDVDRKFRDFGNEAFWTSYWQAMAASYSRWSDAKCAADLLAAAPAVVTIGTGVVNAIITGALGVIPYGRPSFVLLGSSAFAELAQVDPKLLLGGSIDLGDGSGNLSGLSFGTHSSIPATHVLVGTRNAATFYELGGGAPIRVDAVNVAQGGVDVGAFGYAVTGVHSTNGLAEVTVT